MRLEQLRSLDAVVRTGSVRRAAAELHVTAPAVSEQIAGLEDELGVRLLERDSRGSRLSTAGEHLLPRLQRVLHAAREATDEALALRDLRVGRVRLVGVRVAFDDVLPVALGRFTDTHPQVDVEVAEAIGSAALGSLANGDHDIAVVAHPGARLDLPVGLEGTILGTEPIIAAVPTRFVKTGRTPVDWTAVPWVVLSPGTAMRTIFDRHLPTTPTNIRCEVHDAETSRLLVEAGIGAALLPAGLRGRLDPTRARAVTPPGRPDEVGLAVVVDGARALSPAVTTMRNLLLDPAGSPRWARAAQGAST